MAGLFRFLASYEALIYILLAIGGLFAARWLWKSWREWKRAVYQLEREFSMRRFGQSTAVLILIGVLFCGEFFLVSFYIPGLPAGVFLSTPTLDLLATPTGTLSSEAMTQFASIPPQPQPDSSGCIAGQIFLSSPTPAEEIQGTIELVGSVDIPNFGFYKYEVAAQGSDTWATIAAGDAVVRNGALGHWDTSALTPGDYQLRLVVIDNQGVILSPCIVPVRVKAE